MDKISRKGKSSRRDRQYRQVKPNKKSRGAKAQSHAKNPKPNYYPDEDEDWIDYDFSN